MRIAQLELSGFRGVKHGRVVLPRHCVLLGANDVGKTTIAEALALLAGKERLTEPLCDWDFYGGVPTPASRFTLIATITDFGDGSTQDLRAFPQWFLGERSARPVWWADRLDGDRASVSGEHLGRPAGFKNWKRGGSAAGGSTSWWPLTASARGAPT